jgi:hypothetical protein
MKEGPDFLAGQAAGVADELFHLPVEHSARQIDSHLLDHHTECFAAA